jgi:hypothetical protein
MPSIMKILILVAVVWIVWRGFNRISAAGRASRNQQQGAARPNRPTPTQRPVEDMVKCPKCGAYVAGLGNHHCE